MRWKKLLSLALAMLLSAFSGCASQQHAPYDGGSGIDEISSHTEDSQTEFRSFPERTEKTEQGAYPGTADEGMITVAVDSLPTTLNAMTASDSAGAMILMNVMENLIRLDEDDQIRPGAAESWEISDDGLRYTFHLRAGMIWANGDLITANDFAFAWLTALDPLTDSPYAYLFYDIEGAQAFHEGTAPMEEVKIEAVDTLTLEVVLTHPSESFLTQTAFSAMSPVNEAFYTEVGAEQYGTAPEFLLSNGPFLVDSFTPDSAVTLIKNEDYYDADAVRLPRADFKIIHETGFAAFQAGEIDLTLLQTAQQVEQVEADGHKVISYSDGGSFFLLFNMADPLLSNVNLRKALSFAIDRQAYLADQSGALPATSLIPPAIGGVEKPFYKELGELFPPSGDVDKARSYMALAKEELRMEETELGAGILLLMDDSERSVQLGTFIKEQLAEKLELVITVEYVPEHSLPERMQDQDFGISLAGWVPDCNDPSSYLKRLMAKSRSSYTSDQYDRFLASAADELDSQIRMEYFYEAERLIAEDCALCPFYWSSTDYVVSDKVKGIYQTAFQPMILLNAYLVE